MTWRVAASLDVLLKQLNAMAPQRSKKSDGSIGDAAHASRDSDHNPWLKVGAVGVVTARDFTNDPAGGLDCNWLAARLVASSDPRIKYIIWNRRIWTAKSGWVAYKGINPHDKHLHLSVSTQPGWFDSTMPWSAAGSNSAGSPITILPVNPPVEDDMYTDADRNEIRALRAILDVQQTYMNAEVRPTLQDVKWMLKGGNPDGANNFHWLAGQITEAIRAIPGAQVDTARLEAAIRDSVTITEQGIATAVNDMADARDRDGDPATGTVPTAS